MGLPIRYLRSGRLFVKAVRTILARLIKLKIKTMIDSIVVARPEP